MSNNEVILAADGTDDNNLITVGLGLLDGQPMVQLTSKDMQFMLDAEAFVEIAVTVQLFLDALQEYNGNDEEAEEKEDCAEDEDYEYDDEFIDYEE